MNTKPELTPDRPPLDIEPELLRHVQACIEDIRVGKMVILVDDEDRENEGDLTFAADAVTPELINFMAKNGRGLICVTMTEAQIERLELPMMTLPRWRGGPALGTAFTVSIEARHGVTTGISAKDRARTIQVAIDESSGPMDIVTPGHVFPLKARTGGVLVRTGQTEGSVDLARLAGRAPAGVICEIMNDDGSMARLPDLEIFAKTHDLKILTIADLIRYRLQTERLLRRVYERTIRLDQTDHDWTAAIYEVGIDGRQFLALVHGDVSRDKPVLCRMHGGALIADTFTSTRFDGGRNLREAVSRIEAEGSGVIVYLPPTGSLRADLEGLRTEPEKGPESADSPPGALREFGLGAQVLRELGVSKIRLLTNSPRKIAGIHGYGLDVVESVPLESMRRGKNGNGS